jgi:TadE-like protein
MKDTLQNILAALDGKPRGTKGQSLVEMTVTIPVLLLMVLSLIEIGFFANNYLTVMDVVREAGRRGASFSPLTWSETNTRNEEAMDCDSGTAGENVFSLDGVILPTTRRVPRSNALLGPLGYTNGNETRTLGYYDSVVCQAMFSIEPLEFEGLNWGVGGTTQPPNENVLFGRNDMVVSVVSFTRINYNDPALVSARGPLAPAGSYVTITGRYPKNNRYCTVTGDPAKSDWRDPFDFKRSEFVTFWRNGPQPPASRDPGEATDLVGATQGVRGFVFTGNSLLDPASPCGSRFTVTMIENELNRMVIGRNLSDKTPDGAAVLVEFLWQHHPPVLSRLFNTTGNPVNDPMIYVYGVFPNVGAKPTPTPLPTPTPTP